MTRDDRLDQVVTAYLKALEAGERPTPDEWLARHPDLAAELRSFFAAQASIDRVAAPLRDRAGPAPGDTPTTAPGEGHVIGLHDSTRVCYFGDYELLEEIARGGMGVVYRHRNKSANMAFSGRTMAFL
jgi:serine/threonine-protein kinase